MLLRPKQEEQGEKQEQAPLAAPKAKESQENERCIEKGEELRSSI